VLYASLAGNHVDDLGLTSPRRSQPGGIEKSRDWRPLRRYRGRTRERRWSRHLSTRRTREVTVR
jgi:hypothetical protein